MPERTSSMSWLSPRRRRTTGNMKNIPNGQYKPVLDTAEGLILPSRLESTGEEPLSIARRWSQSHGRGLQGRSIDENAVQLVEGDNGKGKRLTEVEEQEQERTTTIKNGKNNGLADIKGLEQQLGHIKELLNTLNTRLEQILDAIEESNGNTYPLHSQLEGLGSGARASIEVLQQLLESQRSTHQAIAQNTQHMDLKPLSEPLASLQESASVQSKYLEELVEGQNATREAVEANSGEIDVSPLVDQMDAVREAIEAQHDPLLEHIEAIRHATERNAEQIAEMLEAQNKQVQTPSKNIDLDLTPMTERLSKIHAALEKGHKQNGDQGPGAGDSKFIISALTSHLSKIQAVTEQNAQSVRSLHSKQSSTDDAQTKMQTSIASTSEAVRSLLTANIDTHRLLAKRSNDVEDKAQENMKKLEKRMEATNSQVRELMTGQREMTKVMRDLASAISAQNKGNCDHVVIPPPRKMGKKVVGFVYDGKVVESPEGSILRQ